MNRADRGAYETSMKCFVLNGKASSDRAAAGDQAKADFYRAKARQAFDVSYAAGHALGLSDDAVTRDLNFTQLQELPKMIRDVGYFQSTAANCKALGLL